MTARLLVSFMLIVVAATAQTTHELRLEADADYARADAALNDAYKAAMSALGDPAKEAVRGAQRAWIPYRDAAIAAEGKLYEGGSLQGVTEVAAAVALTKDQATLLRGLMDPSELPETSGDCEAGDRLVLRVYSDYLAAGYGDNETVVAAQEAYTTFRAAFLSAVDAIPGAQHAQFCAVLAAMRAERLKALFIEGYEGGDTGTMSAGDAPSPGSGLCEAIQAENLDALKTLLAQPVDWTKGCGELELEYPLHVAVKTGNTELVGLLLQHSAPVDQPDAIMGSTPLQYAVENGDTTMAAFLLGRGADVNATDDESFTALDAATLRGNKELIALLEARGGKLGRMAEGTEPPAKAQTGPVPSPSAKAPGDRPVIKGFYAGMPFRAAIERMHELTAIDPHEMTPDGSINWDRVVHKDDAGNRYASLEQGVMLLWKLVADDQNRLAQLYWHGGMSIVLFKAEDLSTEEFVQQFVNSYEIEHMEPFEAPTDFVSQALGGAKTQIGWQKTDRQNGWRLAVHEDKSIVYELVATVRDTAFD